MKKYVALAGLLTVAACGGGTKAVSTAGSTGAAPAASQAPSSSQAGRGASGLLAGITGRTLQVQSETAQTAVTYTASTVITDTVKATAADVKVGSCVMVRSADTGASASSSAPPTAQPTSVTATSVAITPAENGACTAGLGGPAGGRFNGTPPSGAPGAGGPNGTPPSGAPRRTRAGFGGGAFGTVTAVTSSGFVVESTRPTFTANGATPAPNATPSAGATTTTKVTVTTAATTTYTAAKKATAAALKVGECVTARGPADATGTVAATAISIRPATNGTCTTGFVTSGGGGPVG